MNKLIESKREELAALCRKYRVQRLEIFGSAVTESFDPG
jgi:predicted nucleotidyltransferase